MNRTYLRGDMYYADLGRGIGSEQEGYRPVLILQNNTGNKYSPTVIVAAISSKVDAKAKLPTHIEVAAQCCGLPKDSDLGQMVKQKVKLRITEVNRARRRVVGSIRAVQYEARQAAQAEIWNNIEVGKHYNGVVKSMTSYGVFVDIGGVDGMVHISELSWSRIKNPAEVVSVGDPLDVYVISFDPEKRKISLGVKDHSCNPWDKFMETYKVGDVANVRIVKLMTFGAFAEVVPGVDGLIHISQIADRRIEKPGDVLSEGQMVDAKITAVDEEKQKISLSIRALLTPAADEEAEDKE